jgi:methionine salvage enolase-phosphatase E1
MLQNLHRVIETHAPHFLQPKVLTMLSDRQKGLLDGVKDVFPNSPHGYCMRHLEDNFRKEFKHPQLTKLLWTAARATTEENYNEAIENMRRINERSVEWLLSHANPRHWAEVYFEGRRWGHLTSNIAESLNSWILEAREKPILAMLESIRQQLMMWFSARRQLEHNTQGIFSIFLF